MKSSSTQSKIEPGVVTELSPELTCYNFPSTGPLFVKLNKQSHSTLRAGEWTIAELEQVIAHIRSIPANRN